MYVEELEELVIDLSLLSDEKSSNRGEDVAKGDMQICSITELLLKSKFPGCESSTKRFRNFPKLSVHRSLDQSTSVIHQM